MKTIIFKTKKLSATLLLAIAISCSTEEDLKNTQSVSNTSTQEKKVEDSNSICDQENGINPTSSLDNSQNERLYLYKDLGFDLTKEPDLNEAGNNQIDRILDDRTCAYNYAQTEAMYNNGNTTSTGKFGQYRIKAGSNNKDDLQPRIERATQPIKDTDLVPSSSVTFNGDVVIKSVGFNEELASDPTQFNDRNGTYIAQAKGTDSVSINARKMNPNVPKDPAIALILVKPSTQDQSKFKFYLEMVNKRGGVGAKERAIIDLKFECDRDDLIGVQFINQVENGTHEIVVNLKNKSKNEPVSSNTFDVPNPEAAESIKIRYGAYRCHFGEAEILWKNVSVENKKS